MASRRIEELGDGEPMAIDGRRRPYRLTNNGRLKLEQRPGGLRRAVQAGLARVAT